MKFNALEQEIELSFGESVFTYIHLWCVYLQEKQRLEIDPTFHASGFEKIYHIRIIPVPIEAYLYFYSNVHTYIWLYCIACLHSHPRNAIYLHAISNANGFYVLHLLIPWITLLQCCCNWIKWFFIGFDVHLSNLNICKRSGIEL